MTYGSGYRPGDLTAVVGLRTAILMSAPADGDLAVRLWPAVETGDSLDAFLDVLTSVGIRALPDLALVCGDWCNGELAEGRILVRGALTATVHRPEGTEELTADGAATWREWLVRGVRRVVLGRPGPAEGGALVPLRSGIARAACLEWSTTVMTGAAEPSSDATPPPAAPLRAAPLPAAPRPADAVAPAPHLSTDEPQPTDGQTNVAAAPSLADGRWPGRMKPLLREVDQTGELDAARWNVSVQPGAIAAPGPTGRPRLGDHDNRTQPARHRPVEVAAAWRATSLVRAVLCPGRHANRPGAERCRVCAAPLAADQEPEDIAQPALAVLHVPGGGMHRLHRPVTVVGREPRATRPDAALILLPGVGNRVSRCHLELWVREWTLEVVDVSTLGTQVVVPEIGATRLERNRPVRIAPGSELDLAGEVALRVEAVDEVVS